MAVRRSDFEAGDAANEASSAGRSPHAEDHSWLEPPDREQGTPEPPSVKVGHAATAKVGRARGPRKRRT